MYKRLDSGLRGNVGAELAAVARPCVVAPAAPAYGVATIDGVQLLDGRPVTESRYSNTAEAAASARVAESLPGKPAALRLDVIRGRALADALADACGRSGFVVCDSESLADLAAIAAAAARLWPRLRLTLAGSYGLAGSYAIALTAPSPAAAAVLVVSASRQPATLRQLEVLAEADAAAVVVAGSRAATVAEQAATLVRDTVPAGVVVVGGETASALARVCGVGSVEIECEPWPATPVVRFRAGSLDGVRGIVKSGALGDDSWLLYAVGLLRG